MRNPTVLIDLSPIVRFDGLNYWTLADDLVKTWKSARDPKVLFSGIADSSLRKYLDDYGARQLSEWTRR